MKNGLGHYTVIQSSVSNLLTIDEAASSNFKGLSMLAKASASPDLMFIQFILFHEGGNANGDYITRDEMDKIWPSFAGKPITWEHGEPYIGFITDAILVKPSEDSPDPRWHVECGGVIWKARYPVQAARILEGVQHGTYRTSFEIYFRNALYMLGEDEGNIYTVEEAPYLVPLVGGIYEGKKVWRVILDCVGGGAGITNNPADKDAMILSAASNKTSVDVQVDYEKCVAHIKSVEDLFKHDDKEVESMSNVDEKVEKLNAQMASLKEDMKKLEDEKGELEETKAELEASNAELSETKAELEATVAGLEAELEAVKAEFASFKEQVEQEKIEAAKDALANQRLTELKESGVSMSDEQEAKWSVRLREMDDETYADFKDLLVANESADSEDGADNTVDTTTASKTVIPGLNIESNDANDLISKYQELWEKTLSNK